MKLTRVLICHNFDLLDKGIGSLLSLEKGMHVTSSLPKDPAEVLALIARYQPDVLVCGDYLINQYRSLLIRIFEQSPRLRVIVVSAENNLLHIYQKRDILMVQPADLIQAIRAV